MLNAQPWLVPLLAGVLSAATIFVLLITRLGGRLAPDLPNERSLHRRPVPRVGGIGVMLAISAAGLAGDAALRPLVWLSGLLALVSLADDLRGLRAVVRLMAHLLVAAICVFIVLPAPSPGQVFFLVLLLAWGINLFNFMDGANGLAGGMALIGFACLGIAALGAGDAGLAVLAFAVSAAALGFLLFNFDPARIFLGDCGSVPLGFLAGALSLWGWQHGRWEGCFPLLVFLPFLADATITLCKRALRGEKVWEAHCEHYYQHLVRMGWSHRRLALSAYALMGVCGAAGLMLNALPVVWHPAVLLALLGVHALLFLWIDRRWRRHLTSSSVDAERLTCRP